MSAEQLAAAVTKLGLPYTRAQVSNLESGRRDSITVGEVLAFAEVLGVPPALLIFPVGVEQDVESVPGTYSDAWTAYQWLVGQHGDHEPLGYYTRHERAWRQWLAIDHPLQSRQAPGVGEPVRLGSTLEGMAARDELLVMGAMRKEMRRNGWRLPELPRDVAVAADELADMLAPDAARLPLLPGGRP